MELSIELGVYVFLVLASLAEVNVANECMILVLNNDI